VNPRKDNLSAISSILDCFEKASGLVTNMTKMEIFPVRCANIDLVDILTDFPAKLASFPGKYLGLPLHFRRLRKLIYSHSSTRSPKSCWVGWERTSRGLEESS
jgi:hypothetical protein